MCSLRPRLTPRPPRPPRPPPRTGAGQLCGPDRALWCPHRLQKMPQPDVHQLESRPKPSLSFPLRWQTSARPRHRTFSPTSCPFLLPSWVARPRSDLSEGPLGSGSSQEVQFSWSPLGSPAGRLAAPLLPQVGSSPPPAPPLGADPAHQMMHQPLSSLGGDDPQVRLATGGSELGAVGGRRWRLGRDALVQSAAVGHGEEPGGSPSTDIAIP